MGKGEVSSKRSDANESTNYLTKSTSEASKMLEAALLQMDGILSGSDNSEWKDPVKDITTNLISIIQNAPSPPPPPDAKSVEILIQWMQPVCLIYNNQSEYSDAAPTIKRWDNRWTTSEIEDSSGTTSTSEPGDLDHSEESHHVEFNRSPQKSEKSQGCLCQSCLLGYARIIALEGSLPNICTAANVSHHLNCSPFYKAACFSLPVESSQQIRNKGTLEFGGGFGCPVGYHSCLCYLSHHANAQNRMIFDAPVNRQTSCRLESNGNLSGSLVQNDRCVGSLDRRRRKLRKKIDRDLGGSKTKSQSDLLCCDQKNNSHYCSLQQFHSPNALQNNHYFSNNITEERLRKLENERSALHMEISILSEQIETQSNKIVELESDLQKKKDSLRHTEESLQKEVLSRSALETQKLELLSSLSEMKLRQASLEHENLALRNANALTNGERFSRHAGHYSSLPRPPTSSKKGVVFGKPPNALTIQSRNSVAASDISLRCLSAPLLADEENLVTADNVKLEKSPTKAFVQLSVEEVAEWLAHLGLESYSSELKRFGATGSKLLETSLNLLEKEVDIKNPLHKKKLLYAVESERNNGTGFLGAEKMDNAAVLRWLDDIGLPQHKEAFHNAKVDGRVLHRLTTEDLLLLNVTAQLHAASLRRGIQVLRELNFQVDDLERRSANGSDNSSSEKNQVALWTNHRVMEWLRVVDLAEYAPNMRGSGVHGGLMVYEHRFTSELLATLLSIPPAKTLLRRHLTTHFNQIVGREVVLQKREMENTLGFMPLTLSARLKIPKRTQFTLKRKKSKNEVDFGNLVCPLEGSPPGTSSTPSTSPSSPNCNSPTF